jgi:hypothetical protein
MRLKAFISKKDKNQRRPCHPKKLIQAARPIFVGVISQEPFSASDTNALTAKKAAQIAIRSCKYPRCLE